MKKITALNIVLNLVVAAIFVALNAWALNAGLEETFVALALIYGLLTIAGNAIFVAFSCR